MSGQHIAIVGAGIAGLTAAVAFARRGFAVTVIEAAAEISAVGAGLQLSPNATGMLRRLDLLNAIERHWQEIDHVSLVSGTSLHRISEVAAGSFARQRWSTPYGVMRRADLQSVLVEAATALAGCRIVLDRPIDADNSEDLKDKIAGIVGEKPVLIVGADGVHSAVRGLMHAAEPARFSGYTAWRSLLDPAAAAGLVEAGATTAFMGPASHLVVYALPDAVNLVAVVPAGDPGKGHSTEVNFAAAFARWHPAVRAMMEASGQRTAWPLFEVGDGAWSDDGIMLIGDAAHAMMPFAAQGAALAIEDGVELAEAFAASGLAGLIAFAERRRKRTQRVRRRTAFNRFAYHAQGPIRLGRDFVLGRRSAERLASDLDWLYGYLPPEP